MLGDWEKGIGKVTGRLCRIMSLGLSTLKIITIISIIISSMILIIKKLAILRKLLELIP
jgi:hypothetical protein